MTSTEAATGPVDEKKTMLLQSEDGEAHKERPATKMNLLPLLKLLIRSISVEPTLFFLAGGFSIFGIIGHTGSYWKVCKMEFGDDPNVDCDRRNMTKEAEMVVQQISAMWNVYGCLAQFLPLCFIGPIYGAVGDRYGRKANLLIGLSGLMFLAAVTWFQFSFVMAPLYINVIAAFLVSLTGFIGTTFSSTFAYVTDETCDNDLLTYRLTFMGVFSGISNILFGLVSSQLTKYLSFAHAAVVPLGLWFLAFLYVAVFLRQIPPKQMPAYKRRKLNQKALKRLQLDSVCTEEQLKSLTKPANGEAKQADFGAGASGKPKALRFADLVEIVKDLVLSTVQTLSKRREGYKRLYIWLTVTAFLLLITARLAIMGVLGLFAMKSPINWGPADFGYYHVFNTIVELLGSISGTFVMKRLLNLHETSMLLVTLVSLIAKCFMLAFSVNGYMLYAASLLGVVSNQAFTFGKSLTAQFVDRDEVGKVYALFQISTDLAIIFAFGGFTSVYALTVKIFPGLIFLIIAAMATAALVPFIFLHVSYKKFRQESKKPENGTDNDNDDDASFCKTDPSSLAL